MHVAKIWFNILLNRIQGKKNGGPVRRPAKLGRYMIGYDDFTIPLLRTRKFTGRSILVEQGREDDYWPGRFSQSTLIGSIACMQQKGPGYECVHGI